MSGYEPIYGSDSNPEDTDKLFINDTFHVVGVSCNTCNGEDGNHKKLSNGKPCPSSN